MNLKNIGKIFMLMASCCQGVLTSQNDDAWSKALTAFKTGNKEEARSSLETIDASGYGPLRMKAVLAEQEGDLVQALLASKRAQQEAPLFFMSDAVAQSIRIEKQLGHQSHLMPEYGVTMLYVVWPIILQLLFLISWLGAMYHLNRWRQYYRRIMLSILVSICWALLLNIQGSAMKVKRAIITQKTPLLIGPSPVYQERTRLTAGQEVVVQKSAHDGKWYKVSSATSNGWVMADALELI